MFCDSLRTRSSIVEILTRGVNFLPDNVNFCKANCVALILFFQACWFSVSTLHFKRLLLWSGISHPPARQAYCAKTLQRVFDAVRGAHEDFHRFRLPEVSGQMAAQAYGRAAGEAATDAGKFYKRKWVCRKKGRKLDMLSSGATR